MMTTDNGGGSVLIEAGELATVLASDRPPLLADVRWNLAGPPGLPEFQSGHIPGAHWVDLEHELSASPGPGGRHPLAPPEVFEAAMRRIGVTGDRAVVVYDGATGLAASRLWWMLTDSGHPDVRVLNGGFAAWRAAGLPMDSGPEVPSATGDFVARPGRRRQVEGAEVAANLVQPGGPVLVDVRAQERYSGAREPMDRVAGHIPGAVNLPSMANVEPEGRFLAPEVIRARYADAAVGDSPIIYCGSGVTAAHTLLALDYAGLPDGVIYVGSWSDWINDPAHPVALGDSP